MIEHEIENGYSDANARSKVSQDIILKAIASSSINHNITVRCLDGEGQPENTTILLSAVDQKIILSAFYQILGEAEKLAEKARKNNGKLLVYGSNGL